jgi:hypothetical protein
MTTTLLECAGGNLSSSHDNVPIYEHDLGRGQVWERLFPGGGVVDNFCNNKPMARYLEMEYDQRAKIRLEEEKSHAALLDLRNQTRMVLLQIVKAELIKRHARMLVEMEGRGFACIMHPQDCGRESCGWQRQGHERGHKDNGDGGRGDGIACNGWWPWQVPQHGH